MRSAAFMAPHSNDAVLELRPAAAAAGALRGRRFSSRAPHGVRRTGSALAGQPVLVPERERSSEPQVRELARRRLREVRK